MNTDNPDLCAFKARGGKLWFWHGTNDEVIPMQGFYRFYTVPGAVLQSSNGATNSKATAPICSATQMYDLLVDLVEKGEAQGAITLQSPSFGGPDRSAPACACPQKQSYSADGIRVASSYICR